MRAQLEGLSKSSIPSVGQMSSKGHHCRLKAPLRMSSRKKGDHSQRWTGWTGEFAGDMSNNNAGVVGSHSRNIPLVTSV